MSNAPASAGNATQPGQTGSVVLRAVRCGTLGLAWRNRTVRLDSDAYLLLPAAEPCTSSPQGGERAEPIAFELDSWPFEGAAFCAHLRPMTGEVGRILRSGGAASTDTAALGLAAAAEERALRARAEAIGCVKSSTRSELYRRLVLAADFILSHHDEPLSTRDMAEAARLSRFHFARLFSLVHGCTPHDFLLAKRLSVAGRHRQRGTAWDEAAARAGFGSRSALFRGLRKGGLTADEATLQAARGQSVASCCLSC